MKIKCIAIDDEPLALRQISAYILKTPFLELTAQCGSAFEAMNHLSDGTVKLIFVDINMPDLSGMDFVKSLANKPYVVFTTAYSEYAVEGFKVDAVDYLLKPISYNGFLKAANKVKSLSDLANNSQGESFKADASYLFVKSDYKLLRIDLSEIKYIEGMHEYVKIYLANGNTVTTMISMKAIEGQLPSDKFMRVHRSYIVNLSKVSVVDKSRIVFDKNVYIPVSEQYKAKLKEYIDGNYLGA